ncbi:MAG: hypothetical protein Q4A09_00600 [Capnocytophaga felis]|nr:hypothetical protein [Capnocytophaga felis]
MDAIFEKIVLKTAFCCMASDGEIDQSEVKVIEELCENSQWLKNTEFHTEIPKLTTEFNQQGKEFIKSYFQELEKYTFSEKQNLIIIDIALQVILADEKVEYSEVKFFKNIRNRLKIDNGTIEEAFKHIPDIDTFVESDIINNLESITAEYLDNIVLPTINIEDIKMG